jgi:hypothetical protein
MMNVLAITGPNTVTSHINKEQEQYHRKNLPAKGRLERNTKVIIGPLYLFGTNSPKTIPKDNCPDAARPLQILLPMSTFTLPAVAPSRFPTNPSPEVPITIHFLPKMSERRPTRRNPTAVPRDQTVATQLILGEGPISSFMRDLHGRSAEVLSNKGPSLIFFFLGKKRGEGEGSEQSVSG